jgi:tRNA threonylcarbamoyladenosine biosynthesis protein TsaE
MKINFTLNQLDQVVKNQILPLLGQRTIFTFTGPLGAGKTTIIKEILRQSGVTQEITSPTFGYINSYQAKDGITFNHFDLYRIAAVDEFIAAGFDEYLHEPNNISFIEWPQVIEELLRVPDLKSRVCHIKMSYGGYSFESRVLDL